jgi:UDP-N-acetylmuramoyl-tripeptide--D-alanyl-D-alanine ligase
MPVMLTLEEILAALAPQLQAPGAGEVRVRGVSIDSRQVSEDYLFVALHGERTDGHDYVKQAIAGGARLALTERSVDGVPFIDSRGSTLPTGIHTPFALVVPNSLAALQQLAAAHRRRFPGVTVVGVTGSMGKTTAKEAIAAVLAQAACTLKSAGNQNNEIGLPLTLLELERDHCYAVLEMGMYALGEIALLCRLAQPQVGVVLNVGPIHLERLGTIENIASAKAELVTSLPGDGLAILNGDDPRVAAMAQLTQARVITFGLVPGNTLWGDQVMSRGLDGISLRAHLAAGAFPQAEREFELHLQLLGRHAANTALAAAATGLAFGLDWDAIQRGLNAVGYGLRLVPEPGIHGSTLLNDCYNANPDSTMAALEVLADVPGRHIAILGDMLELGSLERDSHRRVGARAAQTVDLLLTVGDRAREIAAGARESDLAESAVFEFMSNAEVIALITPLLEPGDVVLIKGSRGMAMDNILHALQELPR